MFLHTAPFDLVYPSHGLPSNSASLRSLFCPIHGLVPLSIPMALRRRDHRDNPSGGALGMLKRLVNASLCVLYHFCLILSPSFSLHLPLTTVLQHSHPTSHPYSLCGYNVE